MSLLQNMALYASIAGVVAIGATVAIERLGGRLGGILATLPTTIIPASIGIWSQSPDIGFFQAAMFAVPSGMLLNAGFLWLWRVVPPKLPLGSMSIRLLLMTCLALTAWGMGAVICVQVQGTFSTLGALLNVAIGITALMAILGWLATRTMGPSPKGHRKVGPWTLVSRGIFAASAIGCAVWLAAVSGPLAAGMASVFPAIFLTTMVAVWWAQGEAVQGGAVAPMMLGSTSVPAYAIAAAYWIPEFGVAAGATLSWLVAVIGVSVPAAWWVGRSRPS